MEYEYDRNYPKNHQDEDDDDDDDEVAATVVADHDRVTATSYGALDTSQVHDACWLIRIPPALHQLLQQQQQTTPGSNTVATEIGELIFTKGGMKPDGVTMIKPSLTIHIVNELVRTPESQRDRRGPQPMAGRANAGTTTTTSNSTTSTSNSTTTTTSSNSINPSTIPLHYSLQAMTKKIPVMHPFVRHSTTGSCQLLGTVSRTANCQVADIDDHQYRAQLKNRLVTTNLLGQERFVKPVDVTESILTQQRQTTGTTTGTTTKTSIPGNNNNKNRNNSFGAAVWQFGQHHQEYQQELLLANHHHSQQQQQSPSGGPSAPKKARQFAPGQALRSVLFELFEQQAYWTIKELRQAAVAGGSDAANAKRAEAEIRDILRSEIGEYHRSGDHKNKWELRKEFQQQQQKKP